MSWIRMWGSHTILCMAQYAVFQFKGYNMMPGIQGFLSLHAMVLQSVDELSDDNKSPAKSAKTTKETSSAAGSKGKPEAKTKKETKTTKTKSEKKNEKTESPKKTPSPKKVLKKPDDPKETPRKRPAASTTGASNSSPKGMKRPASKVDKGISISSTTTRTPTPLASRSMGPRRWQWLVSICGSQDQWYLISMKSYFNDILFQWYLTSMNIGNLIHPSASEFKPADGMPHEKADEIAATKLKLSWKSFQFQAI